MNSILPARRLPVSSSDETPVSLRTLKDLMGELGQVSLSRVRLSPPIGQATTSRDCHIAGIEDTLNGGTVLPGFKVSIREWFQRAQRGQA